MGTWEHRHRVILAVFAIFRDGDKVLLLKRINTGYMDGYYSMPAGHADGGESADSALCREAREEVGVTVLPRDIRLAHVVHERADGHERINLGFEVHHYTGTLINAEPHKSSELRWASINDLPENTIPSVKDMLQRVAAGEVYSTWNFS
jgi:8-oxo-dGTP pyrophosphatase MutT (NUDIX family)